MHHQSRRLYNHFIFARLALRRSGYPLSQALYPGCGSFVGWCGLPERRNHRKQFGLFLSQSRFQDFECIHHAFVEIFSRATVWLIVFTMMSCLSWLFSLRQRPHLYLLLCHAIVGSGMGPEKCPGTPNHHHGQRRPNNGLENAWDPSIHGGRPTSSWRMCVKRISRLRW